jgi:hypothetical protein
MKSSIFLRISLVAFFLEYIPNKIGSIIRRKMKYSPVPVIPTKSPNPGVP